MRMSDLVRKAWGAEEEGADRAAVFGEEINDIKVTS